MKLDDLILRDAVTDAYRQYGQPYWQLYHAKYYTYGQLRDTEGNVLISTTRSWMCIEAVWKLYGYDVRYPFMLCIMQRLQPYLPYAAETVANQLCCWPIDNARLLEAHVGNLSLTIGYDDDHADTDYAISQIKKHAQVLIPFTPCSCEPVTFTMRGLAL